MSDENDGSSARSSSPNNASDDNASIASGEASLFDQDGEYMGVSTFDPDELTWLNDKQREMLIAIRKGQAHDEADVGTDYCPQYLFALANGWVTSGHGGTENEYYRALACRGIWKVPEEFMYDGLEFAQHCYEIEDWTCVQLGRDEDGTACCHLKHQGGMPNAGVALVMDAVTDNIIGQRGKEIDALREQVHTLKRQRTLPPRSRVNGNPSSRQKGSESSRAQSSSSTPSSAVSLRQEAARTRNQANLAAIEEEYPELCPRHLLYNINKGRTSRSRCDRSDCTLNHETPDGFDDWAEATLI